MTKSADELLAMRFGGATVAENLKRAVEADKLLAYEDGTFGLPSSKRENGIWSYVDHGPALLCSLKKTFLFSAAYDRSTVPLGCRACYKVIVEPRTLRELVAAWHMAQRIECLSKWGTAPHSPRTAHIYFGCFYVSGAEAARAMFDAVRAAIDKEPLLGPEVSVSIYRGCAEYEGLFDRPEAADFLTDLQALEVHLVSRFRRRKPRSGSAAQLQRWIAFAHGIGDQTYLDFTGGKRLSLWRARIRPLLGSLLRRFRPRPNG